MRCVYWFIRFPWVRGAYGAVRGAGAAPGDPASGGLRAGRQRLEERYPDIPLLGVPGNCDYGGLDQPERLTELGGVRILMMHGHTRGVKSSAMNACYARASAGRRFCSSAIRIARSSTGTARSGHEPRLHSRDRRTYGVITLEGGKIDCAAQTLTL